MKRTPRIGAATGALGAGALLAALCLLLLPPSAAAQGQVKGNVGRFFFGPSGGGDRGPDRWGAPRLDALREDRSRPRHRVNVRTIAGHEPVFEKPDPRERHRKRRRLRRPFRAAVPSVIQVTRVDVRVGESATARGARKKAVRRSDMVRKRREAGAAAPRGASSGTDAPAPVATPPGDTGGAGAAGAGTPAGNGSSLLLVPPRDEEDRRDCVLVKVRIPDGITWSHRVSLDGLGVSSIAGASSRLRSEIGRGTALVFRSGEGEFTVPGSRVESMTVGPCF